MEMISLINGCVVSLNWIEMYAKFSTLILLLGSKNNNLITFYSNNKFLVLLTISVCSGKLLLSILEIQSPILPLHYPNEKINIYVKLFLSWVHANFAF